MDEHHTATLQELWPEADHQVCVFHMIQDINTRILDAVRRLKSEMARRGKAGPTPDGVGRRSGRRPTSCSRIAT